jgi:two-component system OmpR family sensor kinase
MTKSSDGRDRPRSDVTTTDLDVSWLADSMRPPITAILAEIATLNQRTKGDLSAGVVRGLERVAHNTALLDRLVGDLHDLAMADAGRFDLRIEHVDLEQLVSEAIELAMPQLDRARVSLEIHHVAVAAIDSSRVLRTLATVLHHAATTGLPMTPIVVRLERKSDRAHISVTDFGPGMTSDQASSLFRRQRITGSHAVLSIGFYVGRKLIEAHGGRMTADTMPGKGSRISLDLPIVKI